VANQLGGAFTNNFGWGNFQIGGGLAGQSAQLLDGAPLNSGWNNTIGLVPAQDTIREFRVMSSNVSPEFGRFGGGVVSMASKSGGSEYHGSAYEYLRNKILNANNFSITSQGNRARTSNRINMA
jgi:hypothetical protein